MYLSAAPLATTIDIHEIDEDDYEEDYFTIERVEPGKIWFAGGFGPIALPRAAIDLAQPGWSVLATVARVRGKWHLIESATVYP